MTTYNEYTTSQPKYTFEVGKTYVMTTDRGSKNTYLCIKRNDATGYVTFQNLLTCFKPTHPSYYGKKIARKIHVCDETYRENGFIYERADFKMWYTEYLYAKDPYARDEEPVEETPSEKAQDSEESVVSFKFGQEFKARGVTYTVINRTAKTVSFMVDNDCFSHIHKKVKICDGHEYISDLGFNATMDVNKPTEVTEETQADLEEIKATQPVDTLFMTDAEVSGASYLFEVFREHNRNLEEQRKDPREYMNAITGVVVYSNDTESWYRHDFPLMGRAYRVASNNKAFITGMGGYSIFGQTLDKSDSTRLEHVDWKVNFAYLEKKRVTE